MEKTTWKILKTLFLYGRKAFNSSMKLAFLVILTGTDASKYIHQMQREKLCLMSVFQSVCDCKNNEKSLFC